MRVKAGCRMVLSAPNPVATVLMLRPQTHAAQTIGECHLQITPHAMTRSYTDSFGNLCDRTTLAAGDSTISLEFQAETPAALEVDQEAGLVPPARLPDEVLQYLLPSRYCESDLFEKLAKRITRRAQPGYGQVETIRKWIHERCQYRYGVSDASSSAQHVNRIRAGVCRDFAHLGIALCRGLQIPARMVSGYLLGLQPMDLHAWFEAYLGDRWYAFDATQDEPRGGRVVVAYGRDCADIAQVTEFGELESKDLQVWIEAAGNEAARDAIS